MCSSTIRKYGPAIIEAMDAVILILLGVQLLGKSSYLPILGYLPLLILWEVSLRALKQGNDKAMALCWITNSIVIFVAYATFAYNALMTSPSSNFVSGVMILLWTRFLAMVTLFWGFNKQRQTSGEKQLFRHALDRESLMAAMHAGMESLDFDPDHWFRGVRPVLEVTGDDKRESISCARDSGNGAGLSTEKVYSQSESNSQKIFDV